MEAWRILRIRRGFDLTQAEMAHLLGTSSCTVMRYERGTTRPDSYTGDMLDIFARAAEDPAHARLVHELIKKGAERSRILWHVLGYTYKSKPGAP